jgi:hypothetical protein
MPFLFKANLSLRSFCYPQAAEAPVSQNLFGSPNSGHITGG